jgi:hypothetical protein
LIEAWNRLGQFAIVELVSDGQGQVYQSHSISRNFKNGKDDIADSKLNLLHKLGCVFGVRDVNDPSVH